MKSLRKTRDANKGLPVSRKQSRTSFRPVGQAHRASFSEISRTYHGLASLTLSKTSQVNILSLACQSL